jgi:NitT/TauT family transport system substrate-binding protein
MSQSRREALNLLAGAAGAGLANVLPMPALAVPAAAQAGRSLEVNLLGFALGIHVPTTVAVFDLLPAMAGYAPPRTQRLDQIRTLTQTLAAGAAECGQTDPITTLRAVEAGADLKIVAFWYLHTSLVFLANADKVRELKDLERPENVVAVNTRGDITEVMLVKPLAASGIDFKKVQVIEIGGSGARMKALQSGRVAAVPIHFDQASALAKAGNFKVLVEPWKFYNPWINEVWVVGGAWLKSKDNERALVDLIKATLTAFRKANDDFAWWAAMYRKFVTLPKANEAKDEEIRPLWQGLAQEIGAWPRDMDWKPDYFDALWPAYKAAGAVEGKIKPSQIVETAYVAQALSELGR